MRESRRVFGVSFWRGRPCGSRRSRIAFVVVLKCPGPLHCGKRGGSRLAAAFRGSGHAGSANRGIGLHRAKFHDVWPFNHCRGSGKEPDDALGLMLAFCAHLMREQVRGIQENDAASAGAAATALEQFLAQHMLPWVSAWRFLVNEHAKTDYYRGVGDLVFGLERALAAHFGIAFNESDGTFAYRAD